MSSHNPLPADSRDIDPTPKPNDPSQLHDPVESQFPGAFIHPSKLLTMLKVKFGNDFYIEMRADTYTVWAGSKLSADDIMTCF
ncbi:hypothetical protein F5Y10DRAFT_67304 [Nemania abortiva]|nr:hypothetical protein F5Y10DRAFT_67304 [Nemania abortiva]